MTNRAYLLQTLEAVVEWYDRKTLDQYSARLWNAAVRLFNGGRDANFEASFIRSIDQQLTEAWNQGAEDVGVAPDEMTEDDNVILTATIDNENNYAEGLMNDIIAARDDGMTREQFNTQFGSRIDLWANRYNEVINRAHMQFGGKQRFAWRLGATEEHCDTCSALNGIVAFGYEWEESRFIPQNPPNDLLECSGWRCSCSLEPTDRRRTPRALDKLTALANRV